MTRASSNFPEIREAACRRIPAWLRLFLAVLAAVWLNAPMAAQEVRRAIPLEPPTPPAVPFDTGGPAQVPTPTPPPAATPTPAPKVPDLVTDAPPPATPSASAKRADMIQLDFANSFYSRKMFDMAAPEYEKYLGVYPDAPDRQAAQFRLGECYRALGDTNAAKLAYQTVLDNFTTGDFIGPAAYRLAELYLLEKNYADAETDFRKASVRVKDPLLANAARFYLARCMEYQERTTEARIIYEDLAAVREGNPFRDASRISLAQILTGAGRKEEAVRSLESLSLDAATPALKAEATVKAGLLKIDLNHPDKAAADLARALKMPEIGQWKEVAQIGLLRVLYETGKYKQLLDQYAVTSADYSAQAKPEVLLLVANSNRQMGRHEPARQLYEQIIREYPGSVFAREAQYERLVSLYTSNDPGVAKEADDYLAQNPDPLKHDQAVLLKAEALYKRKEFAAAAPIYASIGNTRLLPAFKADALFKLGWCYMQTRDIEHAIATYSDFLALYPANKLLPAALAQRAVGYQESKNFAAALRDFNELIVRYPKAKEREFALQQKALTLGQQQDNAAMADTFKQLLAEYPKSPAAAQANYWIGWAAYEAKDYKNALAPLEAARKADKEQFFERATLRLMLSHFYLEEREPLAAEVAVYARAGGKGRTPAEVLRWLGNSYFNDKMYDRAENYLALLAAREGEAVVDDRLNLGRAQLKQSKFDEAAKSMRLFLDQVRQPFPRATGLLVLGESLLGLNQLDDAQKAADEACALQPEGRLNAEGRMLSGDIRMTRLEYEEAAKVYQGLSVVFDDPEITPLALEKACVALKAAHKDQEAAKVLNTLQSKYPEFQLKLHPKK